MIYFKEIDASNFAIRRIMMLEFSQYLENYLWPNYKTGEASKYHMISIVVMLNEKFRERVEVWKVFEKNEKDFPGFFQQVLEECLVVKTPATPSYMREQTALLVFLNHCFNSMEVEMCRNQAKKLVSLSTWTCLQPSELGIELTCPPSIAIVNLIFRSPRTRASSSARVEKILEKVAKA
jgi:intron-binding protein aquarius